MFIIKSWMTSRALGWYWRVSQANSLKTPEFLNHKFTERENPGRDSALFAKPQQPGE